MVNNLPWPLVPFGTLLAEPLRNGIYKTKEFHGRGCKIVNMGELFKHPRLSSNIDMNLVELTDKEKEKSLLKTGDLIFARRSLTAEGAGKCTLILAIHEDTTFESSIIRARLNTDKAIPEFFYYMFNSPIGKWLLGTILRQTAVSGITGSDLAKLLVPCPPLSVQKYLVENARGLDDKITLNRQINHTLEQMAQTLFKSWFVDFDPVIDNALDAGFFEQDLLIPDELKRRAEARKAVRESESFKPLPDDARKLFPDAFEESTDSSMGIGGWVPKGWEVLSLSYFGNIITGKTPSKNVEGAFGDDSEYDLPFITPTDIDSDTHVLFTSRYLTNEGQAVLAKSKIKAGSICVTCIGSQMGKTVLIDSDAFTNQQINSLIPNVATDTAFLFHNLRLKRGELLAMGSSGSTMPILNKSTFSKVKLLTPSDALRTAFNRRSKPLFEKIVANALSNTTLEKLRDTLLPKLISGELRLDDVENEVIAENLLTA